MTAYNGVALTYDEIGNPLTYYNGTSYTFGWEGRRLVSATKGSNSLTFTYNADGIRTSKTKDGVTTTYYLSGSQILAEETNGNFTVYIYDADGSPIGMMFHGVSYADNQWDTYFFEKNLQGDVVAVYDTSGTKLVSYRYGATGRFLRLSHNNGANTFAINNPFLYRGYYYDFDLKFYYLNSRYYDPAIARFINADGYISTGQDLTGYNMFAYCYNNPINYRDESGEFPWLIVSILTISTVVGAILGALSNKRLGEDSKSYDVVLGDTSHEESTELTTTDVVKNTIIGAAAGLAVGGITVGLLGAYGTLHLHSGVKVISWLGVSGVQAWAIGGLSTAIGKFIVEPLFNVLMPDVLEYPS